jgi:4-amino-4-deoxy-L-arabinose transferase-like glycosyltransferase
MSVFGIVGSIIVLFSQLPLMQKFTWTFNLDIFVFLLILLDSIVLFGVLGRKKFVRNRTWVWVFFLLLLMNSLWELAGQTYIDIYQFNIWQNYLILFVGLLLLEPVRNYIKSFHEKPININIDFNNEREKDEIDEQKKTDIFKKKYARVNNIPLLNKLALWFYKQGKWYSVGLVSIFILGFLIRLILAVRGGIDFDEGIHIYDAKMVFDGLLPFRDYFTREPYYIYLLAIFVKIFGANLLTSRLLSVGFSSATIFIIYLIGKRISAKKVGLISAGFFAFSPFVIYNTYLGNLYGVYPFVLALLILSTLNILKNKGNSNIVFAGITAGLAAHFYRITIFYFPIIGFIFGLRYASEFGIRKLFKYYIFLSIPFFFPIIFFSYYAGYRNFEIIYGTNELLIGYIFVLIGYLLGVMKAKWFSSDKTNIFLTTVVPVAIVGLYVVSMYKFGAGFGNKIKILFDSLIKNYHYVYLILFAILIYIKNIFRNKPYLYRILLVLSVLIMIMIGYLGYISLEGLQLWGVSVLTNDFKYLFFILIVFSLLILLFFLSKCNFNKVKFPNDMGVLFLIFFAPIPFFIVSAQWFAGYFLPFTIAGSVIAIIGIIILTRVYKVLSLVEKLFVILVILGIWYVSISIYVNNPIRQRSIWSQKSYIEIGEYIRENTSENEEVFTNALVYITPNNRRSVMDLSRISLYAVSPVDMPDYIGTAKNLIPSGELSEYVKNNVNLILMDSRTKVIFNTNSDFADILDGYHIDKSWPEYEISAWKRNIK